jgi:hypothetical protein
MSRVRHSVSTVVFFAVLGLHLGCASLQSLARVVQPPRFEHSDVHPAEIRLAGPSADHPLGGAAVRIWTQVSNPNPFGFRLSRLQTTLFVGGSRAATGDFPLGLPLDAGADATIPLDLTIDFGEVAGLADVVRGAAAGRPVEYDLEGIVGIDAGAWGEPTFGPTTLLRGELVGR